MRERDVDPPLEQLTFAIAPAVGGGTLTMTWDRVEVSALFTVVK